MEFSVICVYNDKSKMEKYLEKSLAGQVGITYEKIFIDNTTNKYENAKVALCEAVKNANGKYYLFVHQDIEFQSNETFKKLYEILENNKDFGIAGVAGKLGENIYSNITHGKDRTKASNYNLEDVKEVETVDECLFVIKRDTYEKYSFENLTCNSWHLYSVEYSLFIKQAGEKVIVLPIELYHASRGFIDNTYFKQLTKLVSIYKIGRKKINTTVSNWYTNPILLKMQIWKTKWARNKSLK